MCAGLTLVDVYVFRIFTPLVTANVQVSSEDRPRKDFTTNGTLSFSI